MILKFETIRLNITLPKGLIEAMNRMAEPRKRSGFIAEAVRQKIEQIEKEANDKNNELIRTIRVYLYPNR